MIKRFLIEQGYYKIGEGWVASERGNMFAVVKVDEKLEQIEMGDAALDIEGIPAAIHRLIESKEEGK